MALGLEKEKSSLGNKCKESKMSKKLFVGNLPFGVTKNKLEEMFSGYGDVVEAIVITDKYSGRSKGFGFVTLADDAQAEKAISEMNGKDIEGREMTVNEAKPMEPRENRPERSFGHRGGGRRFDRRE